MENKNNPGITPGPWSITGFNELIKMPEHIKIAGYIDGANPDQRDANIRLIKHSPEMYSALQGFCKMVEGSRKTKGSVSQRDILQTYINFQELLKKITPRDLDKLAGIVEEQENV